MKLDAKILITQSIHQSGVDILKDAVTEVVIAPDDSRETLLSLLDDKVSGVIVRHNAFTGEMIEKAKGLKVISRHGIGVELIDVKKATELGIQVVNTPYAAVTSVAEHTVMMILTLAKKFFYADNEFRNGGYAFKNSYAPDDIEGKTLGIIGFGNIGRAVAKRIIPFGVNVVVYDNKIDYKVAEQFPVTVVSTAMEVITRADFLTIHTPLTEETRYMMGAEQFAAMKKTAYFINCARGEVVNEPELIAALEKGVIAGAGLDVFDPEPPKKDNPLFTMKNVVLTPHSSALTLQGKIKMSVQSVEQLLKVLRGEKPDYLVNKEILNQ